MNLLEYLYIFPKDGLDLNMKFELFRGAIQNDLREAIKIENLVKSRNCLDFDPRTPLKLWGKAGKNR